MNNQTRSSIILSSIVFLFFVPSSFASVADQFQQADKFHKAGHFTEAEATLDNGREERKICRNICTKMIS